MMAKALTVSKTELTRKEVMMSRKKVLIVGAGAAGMTAAIFAAREGADVTLLEHKDRVGKKILSTGNGRCNLSNRIQEPSCYRSGQPDFPLKALERFDLKMTLDYFRDLGVLIRDRDGYLYPYSGQASAVLDALRLGITGESIHTVTECEVNSIDTRNDAINRFDIKTSKGTFSCDRLIMACGSKAAPVTGSDGSGYRLAKKLGHHIIKPLPALVQLRCQEKFFKQIAGVRADAAISLYSNGKKVSEDKGEVQFTDYGISGIPVFQVSRYASRALDEGCDVRAVLNFYPEVTEDETCLILRKRISHMADRRAEDFFSGWMHKKLAQLFLKQAGIKPELPVHDFSERQIVRLGCILCRFEVSISGTNSFEQAQICCGGVDVSEIDALTMESKKVKGLYFAGEIMDVDGICGGYNLQWAWSSGAVAGQCAGREQKR